MAKIEIKLPETFTYSTQLEILIQHINRADHLANENLVALLNEARMRYMATLPSAQLGINITSFINADLAVIYKSEAHYGERLIIDIAADDFTKYGCDFVYRVTEVHSGRLVAIAKTAMLHFDYDKHCLSPVPENFPDLFQINTDYSL